jgi:spoIIIJ-associated protein
MSSYDRKQVHDMVSEAGFVSESEGVGKERHIVIRKA